MSSNLKANFSIAECSACILGTIAFFIITNKIVSFILPKSSKFLAENKNLWRFKNTFVSWIHSIIASTLVLYNIIYTPIIFDDMINMSTKFSYFTICVSTGYFIYDAIDIIISNKRISNQSIEVLLHHFVIISIFWVPLFTNQFVGYTLAALSIEFNTVFLHLRFMFVFFNTDKSSPKFRVVSILNLVSFVMFRILTLCWMTRWIVLNRHLIHVGWFSLGSFGLAAMMVINILLLQRLMQSDFKNHNITGSNNTSSSSKDNEKPLMVNENHSEVDGKVDGKNL